MGGFEVLVTTAKGVLLGVNGVLLVCGLLLKPFAPTKSKKKVVIIGSSFSGSWAQRNLAAYFDVTVIDFKAYFEYTPGILRAFVEPESLADITCPVPQTTNKFIQGFVTSVKDKKVIVRLANGKTTEVPFDYLLVGTGSTYEEPIKPTPSEPTLAIRQKQWHEAAAKLRRSSSVLIIGGGPVGVELAGEVLTKFPNKKVTIVDFQDKICAPFHPSSQKKMTTWLVDHGCELVLGTPIGGNFPDLLIDDKGCTLKDGRRVEADVVYKCMGFRANAGFMEESFAAAMDRGGRLIVDDDLQLQGFPGIFAMGDCMIHAKSSEIKLGHTAEVNAHLVVDNIFRLEKGLPPKLYPDGVTGGGPTPKIFAISLGKYDCTLGMNNMILNGGLAAFMKWLLEWTKVMAVKEQPIGVIFWKIADFSSFLLGRTVLRPSAKQSKL